MEMWYCTLVHPIKLVSANSIEQISTRFLDLYSLFQEENWNSRRKWKICNVLQMKDSQRVRKGRTWHPMYTRLYKICSQPPFGWDKSYNADEGRNNNSNSLGEIYNDVTLMLHSVLPHKIVPQGRAHAEGGKKNFWKKEKKERTEMSSSRTYPLEKQDWHFISRKFPCFKT